MIGRIRTSQGLTYLSSKANADIMQETKALVSSHLKETDRVLLPVSIQYMLIER